MKLSLKYLWSSSYYLSFGPRLNYVIQPKYQFRAFFSSLKLRLVDVVHDAMRDTTTHALLHHDGSCFFFLQLTLSHLPNKRGMKRTVDAVAQNYNQNLFRGSSSRKLFSKWTSFEQMGVLHIQGPLLLAYIFIEYILSCPVWK